MVVRRSALVSLACVLCLSASAHPTAFAAPSLAADGTWAEHGTLADSFYPSWYDAAGDRLVALGDWDPGARVLPLAGGPAWQTVRQMPPNVITNYGNTAVDPAANTAWVLSFDGVAQALWDVRVGTGVTAAPVGASGTPPSQRANELVRFDPGTRRLFVMGGADPATGTEDDNTYVLQLDPSPAWTTLAIPGLRYGPVTSFYMDAVSDPSRHRLVLFDGGVPDSFWTLDTAAPVAWVASAAAFPSGTKPAQVTNDGLVLDADGDRVLAVDYAGQPWSFALATGAWAPLALAPPVPAPHRFAALVFDPVRGRLLVNGGRTPASIFNPTSDLWSLALSGPPVWTQLVADVPRPSVRYYASYGSDPVRNRILVYGGTGVGGAPPYGEAAWTLALGPLTSWSPLPTTGTAPATNRSYSMVFDPVRDQMLFFGGSGDVTALSFAGPTPAWVPITPAGPAPAPRTGAIVVYDPPRDRFLELFGSGTGQVFGFLGDAWELRLSPSPVWRALSPAGLPPEPRRSGMAVYDPAHDRLVGFGGVSYPDTLPPATWTLSLAPGDGGWTVEPPAPGPSGRQGSVMCVDPLRQRAVLFGGYGRTNQPPPANWYDVLDDTWAVDLADVPAWHALAPQAGLPAGRYGAAGAYDPVYDRLVVSGGYNGQLDTWTLAFAGDATATELSLESREVDADHVTLVWAGGVAGTSASAMRRAGEGAWQAVAMLTCDGEGRFTLTDRGVVPGTRLQYGLRVGTDPAAAIVATTTVDVPGLALALRATGSPQRHLALAMSLPGAGSAHLALYDLAGRRVWSRDVTVDAAGRREVAIEDARLSSGLYFARLAWGRETRGARMALVR